MNGGDELIPAGRIDVFHAARAAAVDRTLAVAPLDFELQLVVGVGRREARAVDRHEVAEEHADHLVVVRRRCRAEAPDGRPCGTH
jgi:hypothetical protein